MGIVCLIFVVEAYLISCTYSLEKGLDIFFIEYDGMDKAKKTLVEGVKGLKTQNDGWARKNDCEHVISV